MPVGADTTAARTATGGRRWPRWPEVEVSATAFATFRWLFGFYLAVHFLMLVPYAGELFSRQGIFPDAAVNPTAVAFPNPLAVWDSPTVIRGVLAGLAGLSLLFAAGRGRRPAAVLLWLGWACLFNRNNLIANPSIPYVGLLLLTTLLVPPGEGLAPGRRRDPEWRFPPSAYWVMWIPLAVGYTYSGGVKLASPSWLDGSAVAHLLENPLARPGPIRDFLRTLPAGALHALTWGALAMEIAALPLSFWRRGRLIAWLALVGLQLGILTVVAFADLTAAMLLAHLFTFDGAWLRRSRAA